MIDQVIMQAINVRDPLPKDKTRVWFVQYFRPHGRQEPMYTDLSNGEIENPEEFANKVKALFDKPIELSIENTGMGTVYMSAEDDKFLYANAIAPNGPGIEEIIIKFVNEAYDNWKSGNFGPLESDEEPDEEDYPS